jgi:hypothetical protein
VLLADSAGVLRESAGDLRLADPLGGRGSVLADLDQDGWLDLVRRDVLGPPLLDLSLCGDAHWLVVELEDAPPNVHAIGARVRVDTASGTRTGWVTAGGPGYASSGPPEVHVGLGDETDIAGIVITWPDGSETRHAPVAVNQRVRLTR